MKFSELYKNSNIFKIALILALVIIGYISSVFFAKMEKLDEEMQLISSSNKLQLELEKLVSIVSNYETSLRSYIITKDETFLEKRFVNKGEIEMTFKKIKALVSNNRLRIKDINKLEKLSDERFKLFQETLILSQTKKATITQLNVMLRESSECTEDMRSFVYETLDKENAKLNFHNRSHQQELQDSVISAILLIILSLLILLMSFNKMNTDIEELKKNNDELKLLNQTFKNAEKTAGFGYWKLNLEKNTYIFSDNLYRLIGVEPNAFEPKFENLIKYFHPDDVERVVKSHQDSIKEKSPATFIFRIITPNGDMKYIKSVSSFTKNIREELVKININYDITDQFEKTFELEENNTELKAINAELEAFNNIASHDLQEPLRKIQMFISRLEEKETDLLSQQGKDYFLKIKLAANRMQALLIDLLNYSRTIKTDKVFEEIDLNILLEGILQDLSSNIEEKKAVITVTDLPVINAIPFQIEQLFINLISNSLKYSKENSIPEINISTEKIRKNKFYQGELILDESYNKIVISDNGIGFKQEYADQIFLLFKRLETDAKYSGTGLGLAICKRIVDNHNGFIEVKSKPGNGAIFSVYIPKIV